MHRSKFDIRGADAGAGGASGMGVSSSSSDASAMAQSTGSFRLGVLGEELIVGVECSGLCDGCLRASDAIQLSTPCSRRTSPWLHEMPIRPKTGAAMLCSWPGLRRNRR